MLPLGIPSASKQDSRHLNSPGRNIVSGGKQVIITVLSTAKFGAPAAGQKVFVRSKQVLDGYNDQPHQWSGIVPPAS